MAGRSWLEPSFRHRKMIFFLWKSDGWLTLTYTHMICFRITTNCRSFSLHFLAWVDCGFSASYEIPQKSHLKNLERKKIRGNFKKFQRFVGDSSIGSIMNFSQFLSPPHLKIKDVLLNKNIYLFKMAHFQG